MILQYVDKMYWRIIMDNQYNEIPKRLSSYRAYLNLTQKDFCKMLDITQNYYTAIENGNNRLTYENLVHFAKNNGDVGYIITGEKTYHGITEKYISRARTKNERLKIINYICLLTKVICDYCAQEEASGLKVVETYIKFAECERPNYTIWENIRYVENMSQVNMAAMLDIQVKTYRKIEKLKKGPSAEILQTMYLQLGYSPWIFIDRNDYCINEVNKIWTKFPENIRIDLEKELDSFVKFLERYEIPQNVKKCTDS